MRYRSYDDDDYTSPEEQDYHANVYFSRLLDSPEERAERNRPRIVEDEHEYDDDDRLRY